MDDRQASVVDGRYAPVVGALCRALEAEGMRWCHWKSNAFLDRMRSGRDDLDLLVGRPDGDVAVAVLQRLGFKLAVEDTGGIPGIAHYYAYDSVADRLIHVHLHDLLVVGDDLTKNYRLPLENAFLDESQLDGDVRVPARELELIALVVRLVLKHATWDAAIARRGPAPARALAELAFLEERADVDLVHRYVREHLPAVSPEVLAACREALEPGAGPWTRARAGRLLTRAMRPHARRPRGADVSLKLWRRSGGIVRRVLARPPRRKRLASGGLVVAIVGGDGAGKSTAVRALHAWLSPPFAATTAHLGKPPRSPAGRAAALLAALSRRAETASRGGAAAERSTASAWGAVALARDRLRAARAAHRRARRGEIVVCDRYPLPGLLTSMDAPRLGASIDGPGRVARRLARLEQRYYGAIAPPDLLVVLRVDPEVAVRRKPEEAADFLRSRWRDLWETDWAGAGGHVVDAGRPPEDVLRELKTIVWAHL